jgi:hypothetical protein
VVEKPEGRKDDSEYLGAHGKIILKWTLKRGWEVVDWINLAQDRFWWRALVKTVMNLGVHKTLEIS